MIVGDRGLVQWHSGGAVVAQSGNGGMDDFTDGVVRPATFITIRDNSLGGHDTIRGVAQLAGQVSAARNGEPCGEIGLITQKDDFWAGADRWPA